MLRVSWCGLAMALAAAGPVACGDDRGEVESGTTATATAETTGDSGADTTGSTGPTATSTESTGQSETDTATDETSGDAGTETGAACGDPECKLNGAFGLHVRVPVTWEAAGPVAAGAGNVRLTLRAVLGTAGTNVSGSAEVCEFVVPWYLEANGPEKIEFDWQDEVFPSSIPDLSITGTTCGTLPEQSVEFDAMPVQIGVDLPGPVNAAWPADYKAIPIADHDADGRPAFTVLGGPSANAWPPPLDAGKSDRARFVYMASRLVAQAQGMLADCDGGSGDADVPYLDIDVVACRVCKANEPVDCVDQAMDCSQQQIEYLNLFAGNYEVGAPTFKFARIDPKLDCEAIATYF